MKTRPEPRRKGNKRERTRAAVIAAATKVVNEKGFERMTLEDVASRAGMTRGSIYGNFADREDLLLAVVESVWKPILPSFEGATDLRGLMRILGDAVAAAGPQRQAHAVGAASFQIFTLTHPEMRRRLSRWNAALYRRAADHLSKHVPASEMPLAAMDFVRVLHALTDGLLQLRSLTPGLMSDDLIRAAFLALAGDHNRGRQ